MRVRFSRIAAIVVATAVLGAGGAAFALDLTSSAGEIEQVFTRTSDTPVVVPAFSGLNLAVPVALRRESTLIVTASVTGTANSDRGYGMNCSVSIGSNPSIPCHPFSAVGDFDAGSTDTLAFTTVIRDVPKGSGTLTVFLFADCDTACSGSEEIEVASSAVTVAAAEE
jgi:hypothetical protein